MPNITVCMTAESNQETKTVQRGGKGGNECVLSYVTHPQVFLPLLKTMQEIHFL